ncbi:tannase/feruloyl esterase family alpha/beta hydrolase [Streptomyces sp. G44]|uniref:tannase/feruloyl esterase family alpha/beta hydrolase n=1 Tax=Streptomyces sp. G44 TaxID=2807632 RepID=UPI0019620E52|nr:tannase/feruloyl esterase family alpha/beta hydrolase [Streptomyces sp. G44]MBM7169882.1 tannase/feruloyl esterase family alpha/beta hydrolase [Streptomyces sp. G44]
MKKAIAATALACALGSGTLLPPAHAAPRPADCGGLRGLRLPASLIGLPTTGGEVSAANAISPSGGGTSATGAYCRVEAVIHPVDPEAPDITLRVALPRQWNEKSLMFGGGGYDGTIPDVTGNVPFGPVGHPRPLSRGYATYASDSGHQAAPDFRPTTSLDGSFGLNDEAVRNFAGDALKKTHDAARHIIHTYYRTAPAHTYVAGGSSGGREALAVAQRWPTDFDGVIAAYPAWNAAALNLFFGHEAQVLARPGAFLEPADQDLLYRAVITSCDGDDGLRDGVISDEAGCRFRPRALRCPDGEDAEGSRDARRSRAAETTGRCLSPRQIRAVEALSSPLRWKYRLASGETGYPGFPFLSGADMTTPLLGMGVRAPSHPMPKDSGYGVQFWEQWVRYFVTRDPAHDALAVDPRRPGAWQRRISRLSALQDVNDPDLRRFSAAGGKLLLLHGTADELVSHRSTVEYFRRVQKRMGPRATGAFARLYLIPGANHVNVDAAFAASYDSLSALETWTEDGEAPSHPVVTDTGPAGNARTRPLCAYPSWPKYRGHGDPDSAHGFTCHGTRPRA